MSSSPTKGVNKALGKPALISPIELESEFVSLGKQFNAFTKDGTDFIGVMSSIKDDKQITPLVKRHVGGMVKRFASDFGINLEAFNMPVADIPPSTGPAQVDAKHAVLSGMHNHFSGLVEDPIEEDPAFKALADSIHVNDGYFNESEGDGVIFNEDVSAIPDEAPLVSNKPNVRLILNDDGLSVSFESSLKVVTDKSLTFIDSYAGTVRNTLFQCCQGKCAARNNKITFIGATDEEVEQRLAVGTKLAELLNNGYYAKVIKNIASDTFEIVSKIRGKDETREQTASLQKLDDDLCNHVYDSLKPLAYIDTGFVFNGEEYSEPVSVGPSAQTCSQGITASATAFAVQVQSISYDLIIDGFKEHYDGLVAKYGFDIACVDAEIPESLRCIAPIFLRSIKTVVCGLTEHMIDVRKLLASRS